MSKEENKFMLEVDEAIQEDIDKGIARITTSVMDNLGIVSGDLVEIKGKNVLIVRAMRALDNNFDNKIRLDGTARSNIGVSIGERISVDVVKDVKEAKVVVLSPLQEMRLSKDSGGYFHDKLLSQPLVAKQKLVIIASSKKLGYVISKVTPKGAVVVTPSTKVEVSEDVYSGDADGPGIYYEDIGGLKDEIELVREMVELPMKQPEVFEKLGVGAPKGVLLTGPPGTGKTLLARAVASETDSAFFSIAGPEIMSKYYGESEKHIREVFEKAQKSTPAIIFIDEIDSIAPKRGAGIDQTEKRIVAQLLTLMDGLKSRGQLVVMAATNRPEDIDEALRRPGRFDRELKINPPTEEGRREILQIHTRGMPLDKDVNFTEIANRTIGFTGADLEVLCKEAALKALKPHLRKFKNMDEKLPAEELDRIKVGREHFIDAMRNVEPSAMREVLIVKPNVTWNDIGGLEKAKEKLRELVELPLLRPELFKMAGIKPSKGVLLHGPPGTGKTLLAKAVANESNANFISVKGPELVSKWVGESEKHVREIFKKARQVAPAIIFFDEFDSISKMRGSGLSDSTEKIVNQLLTELDGVEELEKVVIIAATNRRDLIDEALLRAGRIDAHVELPMPDKVTREAIFKVHLKKMPLGSGIDIKKMVGETEGWTGADIETIAREAGMKAIKRVYGKKDVKKFEVTKDDFDFALKSMKEQLGKNKKEDGKMDENKMIEMMTPPLAYPEKFSTKISTKGKGIEKGKGKIEKEKKVKNSKK
jgi:transitional endoplasmic reticulum ATPase